jgi:hypothetical protein
MRRPVLNPRRLSGCASFGVGEVYIVTDPERSLGEFIIYVTMDKDFRMLAHALG